MDELDEVDVKVLPIPRRVSRLNYFLKKCKGVGCAGSHEAGNSIGSGMEIAMLLKIRVSRR